MKSQKTIAVTILCLIFTTLFLYNTKSDFPLIFKKDLLAHDESSNSVVAANITRKFFPPMVRINPLVSQQGNWMEGPFWQHIPPLFAYVPYLFFKLDGQVTIEVKRLSFAFLTWLTGLLFIFGIYKFKKSLWTAAAATIAVIFWISTPFTHELITGYAFGVSDIVLAFSVVASFCAILWYLNNEKTERLNYPVWKLIVIGAIVALPVMAKNLLGAIPAATYFILLLRDHRAINKKVLASAASFLGLLSIYYLPLYFASPETFKNEILVSFLHFKKLEGWDRPWHFYVTNYLPQRYLGKWSWVFFAGLIFSGYSLLVTGEKKDRILLWLSGGWFVWNLVVISIVTSKVPNFIYQSFLLSLFFIVYSLFSFARSVATRQSNHMDWIATRLLSLAKAEVFVICVLILSILVVGYESVRFAQAFSVQRSQPYAYSSEHEKFYQTAEELRSLGLNTKDLVIVHVSDNDCWFRYYPMFLTGTESKTLLEMYFGYDAYAIKDKYQRMFFITNKTDRLAKEFPDAKELANYTLYGFDLTKLSPGQINDEIANFVADQNYDIPADISRIKKDKTSCQWLVPDSILNAP